MRSYFQPRARFFTPAIICRAVIFGPDLNLRRAPWFIAAIFTVVPPTSTTSTVITPSFFCRTRSARGNPDATGVHRVVRPRSRFGLQQFVGVEETHSQNHRDQPRPASLMA